MKRIIALVLGSRSWQPHLCWVIRSAPREEVVYAHLSATARSTASSWSMPS